MSKILSVGDEVLVFRYVSTWGPKQDYEHYIKGTIISSELSDDLSYHGSSWNEMTYTVLGEDGYTYFGNYMYPILGSSFFLTGSDYTSYLENQISSNQREIETLENKNFKLNAILKSLQNGDRTKKIGGI